MDTFLNKIAFISKTNLILENSDKINLIVDNIKDPLIIFAVETASITEPVEPARYFRIAELEK